MRNLLLIAVAFAAGIGGCGRGKGIGPAEFPAEGAVFLDQFASGVTFQAFLGSKLDALDVDLTQAHSGAASLSAIVPDSGDPSGSYAGGAFTTGIGRNLSGFDALTFWAKASRTATLNVVGIGNDNSGTSVHTAEMYNLPLTTAWTQFVVPIPLPDRLKAEGGLFFFAEGPENGVGCQIWFDEIQYETLGTVTGASADLGTSTLTLAVGQTDTLGYVDVTLNVSGIPKQLRAMPGYLDFTSSNTGVVSVSASGVISAVGEGTARLTAKLGAVDASGWIDVTVTAPEAVPTTAAPMPTVPAANVISLYSDAYTDVTVGTWSADWDDADVSDEIVASDHVKKYSHLVFAGIEFTSPTINASTMTAFHMDIWTPNATASPAQFRIKLVDFGANGIFGGGDDVEHELTFTANTAPALATGSWVSIDLPLSAFSGLLTRGHLAQMIIAGTMPTVYVDNVYFYSGGATSLPGLPAPTPTRDPADVISLFSDVYTNVPVDTWSAPWDVADVQDYPINGNATKKYTRLTLAGIELRSAPIDVTGMTHFHMDVWTPDPTRSPAKFKVRLVDFGPNGIYEPSGGDDVSAEVVFDHTAMSTGFWFGIDVRLTDFTALTTRAHIGQLILSGDLDTIYVDNVYFYDSGIPSQPTVSAPVPTLPAADVISLFSDAYADVPVDTWSAAWDVANVSTFVLAADSMKKYTGMVYAGIELTSAPIDATDMTHFHMDYWTPDPTAPPAVFKIKLVDFGADGAFGGGDDVEHELTFTDTSTPALATASWVSFEIPLADFINLTTRAHLAQMVIVSDPGPNTVFIDNVYLHK